VASGRLSLNETGWGVLGFHGARSRGGGCVSLAGVCGVPLLTGVGVARPRWRGAAAPTRAAPAARLPAAAGADAWVGVASAAGLPATAGADAWVGVASAAGLPAAAGADAWVGVASAAGLPAAAGADAWVGVASAARLPAAGRGVGAGAWVGVASVARLLAVTQDVDAAAGVGVGPAAGLPAARRMRHGCPQWGYGGIGCMGPRGAGNCAISPHRPAAGDSPASARPHRPAAGDSPASARPHRPAAGDSPASARPHRPPAVGDSVATSACGSGRLFLLGFLLFLLGLASRRCSGLCRSGPGRPSSSGVRGIREVGGPCPAAPRRQRYRAWVKGRYA